MVQINFAQKQVNAKVVYYGPGMSGKTTNLEVIHQRAPQQNRGDLTSISTDGDRTLFFDFMPLDLGTVAGMRTCFQIYTVPGQVYYNSTRKLVLQGVDGVVFVADSSASMVEENLESFRNLEENLADYGKSLATLPHIIQFNKRDLPDAMAVDELNAVINKYNVPTYEAVANSGQGVFPTLKALAARVLESIHSGAGSPGKSAGAMPPPAQAPTLPPPPPAQQPVQQQPQQQPVQQPHVQEPHVQQPPVQQPAAHAGHAQPQQPAPTLGQTGFAPQGQQPQSASNLRMVGENGGAAASYPQQRAPQPQAPAGGMGAAGAPGLHQSGFHPQAQRQQQHHHHHAAAATAQHQGAPATMGEVSQMMRQRPEAAAAPARRPPARPNPALEGTRFRPRQTRPTPRATPQPKGRGNGVYTALFVVLALAVAGVVGKVVLTFF